MKKPRLAGSNTTGGMTATWNWSEAVDATPICFPSASTALPVAVNVTVTSPSVAATGVPRITRSLPIVSPSGKPAAE